MRGHIIKRYKDSYTVVLNLGIDPATGKRKQQWVTVKGTKKDAEKKLAELLHQLDTGAFMKPGKTTVKDFLERWLDDYARPNLAPRTVEGYEHICTRHLIPSLGNVTLAQLKPEHIQKYLSLKLTNGRCDGRGALSPRTLRHHYITLHTALETAVKWGLILRNPSDAISPPRFQRTQWHTLNEDDIRVVLQEAKSTPYYAFFFLALFTGMRRSELLALRWCDIDLLMCQIYITRTLHHLRNGDTIIKAPKTARGSRMVSLSPSAALMLREHKGQQGLLLAASGTQLKEDDFVFQDLAGKPFLPDTVTHSWAKLIKRIGLVGIRLHDARHSHASLMLKQGIHPKIVQERLGHASIQVTLDTYSHVAPGLQEAAAIRFDELVLKPQGSEIKSLG